MEFEPKEAIEKVKKKAKDSRKFIRDWPELHRQRVISRRLERIYAHPSSNDESSSRELGRMMGGLIRFEVSQSRDGEEVTGPDAPSIGGIALQTCQEEPAATPVPEETPTDAE
jgi:hypothetical protein